MSGDVSKSVKVTIDLIDGVSKKTGSITASFGKLSKGVSPLIESVKKINDSLGKIKSSDKIKNLSKDLKSISLSKTSVNNIGKLAENLKKFKKSSSSNISNIAKSLKSIKSTDKIKNLSKDLKSISLSKTSVNNIGKLAENLKKLKGVKLPSFSKLNNELDKNEKKVKALTTSYKSLFEILKRLKIKNIGTESKSTSKQIKNLNNKVKKSKTSFSQLGFAIGSASTGLSKFGTRIYGVTRGFSAISKNMGLAMSAFTTAFTTLFALKGVITDISKFDDAIRGAGAVAQASSVQLTQLSDAARAMGESTRYTAIDAADALKALAMTGLDVNESIATLPTVLNVAAAANMSLGESADIVTNIMVGYGKEVKDLPKIADLMTAAFTNANTSLSEIGVALKYVGPVANAAGQSLEETTGILASLANAGYRGSKAGVILRTSIANLLAPTEKMKGVLHDYGISMSDLTKPDGTMNSFTDILALMAEKGLKTGDALTLFGKRAGPGVLALLEQGIPALEEMNAKIAQSEGIALKVAYEMEEGLGGALRRLKSMWDEVSIAIGKVIEQDVEKFITNLTKSLNKNKEQIVGFVSALFSVFKMLAKVGVGVASFVTEHAKLVLAIGAISLAIKALTLSSATLLEVGLVKYLVGLYSSIKWSGIAAGITNVAKGLNAYTLASKSASTAGAVSSLTTLGAIGFSSIITGLRAIGSALLALGVSAAKAAMAFALTPIGAILTAIAVAATVAYAAVKLLSTDYEGAARSAEKLASSAKEANRELEYQLAELKLINNEFERDSSKGYSDAEQRLMDVINATNFSIEDKIKFLKEASGGADEAKEAIKRLREEIEEEKKANDNKEIKNATLAREMQAKAVEKQAEHIKTLYGLSVKEGVEIVKVGKLRQKINSIEFLWFGKKQKSLQEDLNKYGELEKKQKAMGKNYESLIAGLIVSGKSSEDLRKSLEGSGASYGEIDKVVASFKDLKEEADKNADVMNGLKKINAESIKAIEEAAQRQVDIFKSSSSERESIQKKTLYNISMMEAKGQLDHESAEMAKLQATLDSSQQQIQAAQELYTSMNDLQTEGKEKALAEITKAEEKAAGIRLKILEKISNTEEKLNEKLSSLNSKRSEESARYDTKTGELREKLSKKQEEAEVKKTEKISEINEKLSDKLASIEEKLSEKRSKLQEKRVEEIASSAQKISGIEASTEDKLREIKQRGMSDYKKNESNREAAAKKLQDGQELVAKAKAEGDTAALERGTKLIEQSSELYSGLKKESEAINGVKETSEALKAAEIARSELDLAGIDEKIKAEENAAKKSEQIAKDASQREKEKAETGYDKKLKEANEFYETELQKENDNHSKKIANIDALINKNNQKLETINNEKTLVLGLIEEYKRIESFNGGASGWEKANTATNEAIFAIDEYKKTVDGLNDHEVNIKFTGQASEKEALGKKIKKITKDLAVIGSDLNVNVSFTSSGKGLSAGLKDVKNDIESIEITVPVSASIEELSAVIALVDRYKKIGINIKVNVESGELNNVANILKNMVNKAVAVTMKIIGYDDLVKAKNMIDSLKSKTITITTKQRTISEKAAGGYIEPEKYATGGNVFKRLSSPYIGKGGGKKDDVPAMLMKGEFVQKVSAVQKYGKNFMAKLNAGMIPKSVARMFNSGGEVQPEHYASGGHVGYKDLPAKQKKKILYILNQKVSDISKKASDPSMITEMGDSSIKRMTDVFSDSVAKFAIGGNISQSTSDINNEKNEIIKQYSDLIKKEKDSGNQKVADVMTAERDSLSEIAENLKNELLALKEDYDEYIADTTESYTSDNSDRDEEHNSNVDSINSNYNNDLSEKEKEKKEQDEQDQAEYKEEQENYNLKLQEINDGYESIKNTIYKELSNEKDNLRKIADDIYYLGKNIKEAGDYSQMWEETGKGTQTMTDYSPMPYSVDKDNPTKTSIQLLINSIKNDYTKKENFESKFNSLWADFSASKNALNEYGIANPTWLLSGYRPIDLENYSKKIADARKKDSIKDVNQDFAKVKGEYVTSKNEGQLNYDNSVKNLSDTKKNDIDIENQVYSKEKENSTNDFNKAIAEAKDSYNDNVKNTTQNYSQETESVKEASANDIISIKDNIELNIESLEKEKQDQLGSLVESQKVTAKEEASISDTSTTEGKQSVFDFLKKKLKIFGFNTGGFVNSTSDSVPGKDSILSALTPNEYVMKASVVSKFGRGFFDSLNNFRIPQFNMGGAVGMGNIGGDDLSTSTTTRYALDLTLNGSKQGELTGSQSTIQNMLNELSIAKLSSQ